MCIELGKLNTIPSAFPVAARPNQRQNQELPNDAIVWVYICIACWFWIGWLASSTSWSCCIFGFLRRAPVLLLLAACLLWGPWSACFLCLWLSMDKGDLPKPIWNLIPPVLKSVCVTMFYIRPAASEPKPYHHNCRPILIWGLRIFCWTFPLPDPVCRLCIDLLLKVMIAHCLSIDR